MFDISLLLPEGENLKGLSWASFPLYGLVSWLPQHSSGNATLYPWHKYNSKWRRQGGSLVGTSSHDYLRKLIMLWGIPEPKLTIRGVVLSKEWLLWHPCHICSRYQCLRESGPQHKCDGCQSTAAVLGQVSWSWRTEAHAHSCHSRRVPPHFFHT